MIQKIPTRKGAVMLVLVVVAVSGCLGSVNADEVREESLDAMEKTDTYRFDMEMNMSIGDGTLGDFSVDMNGEGAVNESSDRMRMSSEIDMGEGMEQEVYVVDGTMYQKTGGMMGDGEGEWYRMNAESAVSQTWNTSAPAGDYEAILEISDVSHEGDAEIDGESAYVLSLKPDTKEYNELLRERLNGATGSGGADTPKLFGEGGANVEEASVQYWISKESGHVLRTNLDMTVSFDVGGNEGKSLSANVKSDVRMYDHGDEVSIELPEEARDASNYKERFGGNVDEGEGVDAGTDLGEIPDEEEVDRKTDNIIDRVESEVQSSEAFGEMHTAKVYISDSFDAESLGVEGLESGASAQTDSPGSVTFLSVVGISEGEEIAVTATKEDGTVVRQTTTYEP